MSSKEQKKPLSSMKNQYQKMLDINAIKYREGRNLVQSLIKLKSISKQKSLRSNKNGA